MIFSVFSISYGGNLCNKLWNPTGKSTDDALVQKYSRIDWSIQDKVFYRMGINVIWFQDFSEIPEILNEICGR